MNTFFNKSELVSELYHELQPEPVFDNTGSLLNESEYKTLWDNLESLSLEVLYKMYCEL